MIVEGEIDLIGVHIPVVPQTYGPDLQELEELGSAFEETVSQCRISAGSLERNRGPELILWASAIP
jgi:hypothetical protein